MTDKKCTKCVETKPLTEFYIQSGSTGGYQGNCKVCDNADNKAWREANKERIAATKKAWRDANKERIAATNKAWREANKELVCATKKAWCEANPDKAKAKKARKKERWPEKFAARRAVMRYVAAGKLVKQPCEVCGSSEVHGHHDDYSKPLEVRWLCPIHHNEHHTIGR